MVVASGVGGVGDGGVFGVGAGGGGLMVRVPGTLRGSALLGFLLAIPAEGAAGVAGGEGVVVLLWCSVLLGWWGPLVDVDDAPGDFDAPGVMVCGVAVSTLGWGPGGWRWWRLFASRAGVLGVAVGGGALGVTLCRGRGGGDRGVVGDGTSARRWWGFAVVWILLWVLAALVLPTVRVSRWWLACLVVV